MKNKKTIGIVVITLLVASIIYLFRDRLKAMLPQAVNPDDESNPATEPSPDETNDTGGIDTGGGVYAQEGCGGAYTNQLDEIAENDPASNLGGCGSAVVAWQQFLNTVLAYDGSVMTPIAVDGKYGPATEAFHNQYLNNLPSVGRDITAPLFEAGSGASLN